MLGLELIMAAMLSTASAPVIEPADEVVKGYSMGHVSCQVKIAPKINVLPTKSNVQYDYSKSKFELNSMEVDTTSPYGPDHLAMISGLMRGAIQVTDQVKLLRETYDNQGLGCVYVHSIDVKVHIDPTIYIANDFPKGSCMHESIMRHEHKHVREDQLIVNKYANIIGQSILGMVQDREGAFGPFKLEQIEGIQGNIENSLHQVINKFNAQMNAERRKRQQAIDNLDEYESIRTSCDQKKQQK